LPSRSQGVAPDVPPQISSARARFRTIYALLMALAGLGALVFGLVGAEQPQDWAAVLVLTGLSFLVQRSSFHLGSPVTHSLAGVIDVAAVLALGPLPGAVVAFFSGLGYLIFHAVRHRRLTARSLILLPLFNAGLKAWIALVGGALYARLGGTLPLRGLDSRTALAAGALCLAWFVLDHLGWAMWEYLDGGQEQLRSFVRQAFPDALLIELLPLPFAMIVALVFTRLGWGAFLLLALLVVIIAVLVRRWADARSALVQRVAELSIVERIGRAIVEAELDVDELAQLMYEHACQVVDATIFLLGLFEGDEYHLKLWMRAGERLPAQTFQLKPGLGLVNWMREAKEPILVRDFPRDLESLPAQPISISEDPPRSALYVPLIAGETVVGTMSIQSFQRAAYGEGDLRVLSAMANQAAVAMQKAQLYDQERKRARQLETIGQVSRQVTAVLDLDELFGRVVALIRDNFGYYYVGIFAADADREDVIFKASASAGQREVSFEVKWGEGLIGLVAAQAETLLINDVEHDTRYRCVAALEETKAELAVPLLLEGEVVGVLDAQSDEVDAFGSDDVFILETLGAQVATAIQEARLYQAEQQQAWLSTALLQVADAMSQVSDMDSVLTTIVRLTPILAGVDRCALLLWDGATESFLPAQTYGLASSLRETFEQMVFPLGAWPALDLVRLEKRPFLVNVAEEQGLVPPALAETFFIHEMVTLPLLAQGELLGVMLVDYAGHSRHFGERLITMLSGIANQAAMVLQTARLVQAQQEETYISMALLQVAQAVNRSTDLQDTLATVARITPMFAGVESSAFLLENEGTGIFEPAQQYGLRREGRARFQALYLDDGDPLVRRLRLGEALVALDDLEETSAAAVLMDHGSALALPLLAKGEMLGIMIVDHSGSPGERFTQRFSERRIDFLRGIAGQAAMAVENARLLREAAEQERMKQELQVARQIQVSFLPECCPNLPGWELAAIWRSARQVGGDFYDFIPLFSVPRQDGGSGEALGLVIADVADKGVPAALFMALSRTLMRTVAIDGRSPAATVARTNELILADARTDLFVTLFYALLRPDSGRLSFVNAGHMPPMWVRAADGTIEELHTPGMALGVLEQVEFHEDVVDLEPGDAVVLYTDGLTEATNAKRELFGRHRLAEVLRAHHYLSAEELARAIDVTIAEFVGDAPQADDFTLLVAKRKA
jgi:serine phosphatase RsbU (regulator of sigma subunit)/putative methionine-R-sulfoxide reductase with GAF domain